MNAQEYNLNIRPGYGYSQTVKVSQDDIGRPLEFHLYDGMDLLSITTASVITIHATKPSGLGFTETCTWSGSTASISTTESMTQESGAFPAELVITSGGDVLGTANFTFCVERSPHQTGTTDGVAEDLQDIYEQLDDLKEEISELDGLSDDVKTALMAVVNHVGWDNTDGQQYIDALYDALYAVPPATLVSISAVYTQSGTVYDTDNLNSLKADLVVTALYDDQTTKTVTTYELSGTLTEGTSTITVTYNGKTTTFNVTVTLSRTTRFGTFTAGYSLGKKLQSSQGSPSMPLNSIWNNAASARAATTVPVENRGYVITSTNSSKYNVNVYDITDDTAVPTDYALAVTQRYYQGGTKTPAWTAESSATTPYIMIALKKNDNTEFTAAELADGAAAVFTFTESE